MGGREGEGKKDGQQNSAVCGMTNREKGKTYTQYLSLSLEKQTKFEQGDARKQL